ncbi:hypothetical protein F0U44_05560 [Nocardioides humilatus]|uniref:Hemolysin-type calcium-binding repeat-containing protein n=1 Tax=Nocardioides humilatus TaxID=2607660 RepID=A0A5B1LNP9_9ACTN|nr:hypothetical protein [Nocardioides humilatus]KAA1421738.1 hypothetical protein F0U44_05560 [Nocardioides humilatus]
MSRSSSLLGAAVLAISTLGVAATGDTASAGVPTCHDQTATIVGTPGGSIDGTDGPDIVVTNGATEIQTGDGDDLVCVTGGSGKDDADVQTDDGDDVIDASTSTSGTRRVYLGDGDDTYTGGPGPDQVVAGDPGEGRAGEGADTVATGAGYDYVVTGGTASAPDHDAIDLGPGRDDVTVEGPVDPGLPLIGGEGRDRLALEGSTLRHFLRIDNVLGRATDDDVVAMTWSGMEDFRLAPSAPWEAPSFTGNNGAEHIWTSVPLGEARLNGGDDRLNQDIYEGRLLADAFFEGGHGHDTFILMAGAGDQARRVVYDRRNGSMLFERGQQFSDMQVDGFERFRWSARRLEVYGTASPEHFEWSGCHGFVAGRGGDDVLELISVPDADCGTYGEDADLVTRGGPGDDRLLGNYMPDILLGGPGTDVARGDRGNDRCVAETEVGCER